MRLRVACVLILLLALVPALMTGVAHEVVIMVLQMFTHLLGASHA